MKKVGSAIGLASLLLLAVAVVGMRLAGLSTFAVMSGSMVPEIPVGALVIVRATEPGAVRVGDVITFALPDRTVTHRVVSVDRDAQGLVFTTKGDANPVADQDQIRPLGSIGVAQATLPFLGYGVVYAQVYWRLLAMAVAALVFVSAAGMLLFGGQRARATAPALAAAATVVEPAHARQPERAPLAPVYDDVWARHLRWLRQAHRVAA